jgi:hypothetical protein
LADAPVSDALEVKNQKIAAGNIPLARGFFAM